MPAVRRAVSYGLVAGVLSISPISHHPAALEVRDPQNECMADEHSVNSIRCISSQSQDKALLSSISAGVTRLSMSGDWVTWTCHATITVAQRTFSIAFPSDPTRG